MAGLCVYRAKIQFDIFPHSVSNVLTSSGHGTPIKILKNRNK
jgi:hypothetical protein